jgi:hypothetical protein
MHEAMAADRAPRKIGCRWLPPKSRSHLPNERDEILAACDRLLKTEAEVSEMPAEQRDWFNGKPGHQDAFKVAKALKQFLTREWD